MGITGLLQFVESATEKIFISDLKGSVIAIDSYCLLHKGSYACSEELFRGTKTTKHIDYCLKYVNLLLSLNIKPIMVFDGNNLPAKSDTELKRRESRDDAKSKAIKLMQNGRIPEARRYMSRCVNITHKMALELIKQCRLMNVDCIVAPYEADSQLYYLTKLGIAEYIISEDSDLILFGCKKVIFKLKLDGTCSLVNADKLPLTMKCNPSQYSFEKFRLMCILSGCDYIDSLPGIGLSLACKFVLKTAETDVKKMLPKIPIYLNKRNLEITDEYIDGVLKALATFKFMYVYDPLMRKMVRLNEPSEEELEYCGNAGELINDKIAFQLALGNIDPRSHEQLDNYSPDNDNTKQNNNTKRSSRNYCNMPSMWKKHFNIFSGTRQTQIKPAQPSIKSLLKSDKPSQEVQQIMNFENDVSHTYDEDELIQNYSISNINVISRKRKNSDSEESSNEKELTKLSLTESRLTDMTINDQLLSQCTTKIVNKFRKTVVNEKTKVVSRFFKQSNSKLVNETKSSEIGKLESQFQHKTVQQMKFYENESNEISCEINDKSNETNLIVDKSTESNSIDDSSNNSNNELEESPESSNLVEISSEKSQNHLEQETIDNKSEIIDLDEYSYKKEASAVPVKVQMSPAKKRTITVPKISCRRVGLNKLKTSTTQVSAIQTKLSAFGFQKKASIS